MIPALTRTVLIGLLAVAQPTFASGADIDLPDSVRKVVGDAPVVLLSAAWCGYCAALRKSLRDADVEFTEWDIETTDIGKRARALLPGGRFVPVTIVGEIAVFGADAEHIIELSRKQTPVH
jgi:glutaredoxin 3